MALQTLKVWAKEAIPDAVKGNTQFRELRDEEWLQGWGRLFTPTVQQLNSLFRLITQHSSPSDISPYLYPSNATVLGNMLVMDGQAIDEATTPILYQTYGGNLNDMSASAPTGFVYVVLKQ